MYSLPPADQFESEQALLHHAQEAIDSTDLGIVLYVRKMARVPGSRPGHVPLDVFGQLAEQPNVVGAKVTQVLDAVSTYECCVELGHELLLGPVNLEMMPFIARICPISSQPCGRSKRVNRPRSHTSCSTSTCWRRIAWTRRSSFIGNSRPLVRLFWEEQAPILARGGHPWVHLKYHQWSVGGNGGLFRPPTIPSEQFAPVRLAERQRIKDAYKAAGISPREPDEEFLVGRVNFAAGGRPRDLGSNPMARWD